jgi:predicted unusual protein kinase regulating ubiquinone biosynthesis (AarF/ABC1/UbiB family)
MAAPRDFPGAMSAGEPDGVGRRNVPVPAGQVRPVIAPPMARRQTFRTSIVGTLFRLVVWLLALVRYLAGTLGDALSYRNSVARRAKRLRHILESLGPTFVKLGQQLSVRADVLPYEYCAEFSEMLDSAPPFPVKEAMRVIEEETTRSLSSLFTTFVETPIGSASLACVYKAQLQSGDWVAVKVQRPGVGVQLASELRALGWLLKLGEWLTVLPSGFTRMLRSELSSMLLEELDFRREARNAEMFLKGAEEDKQDHVGAPRVYFDLSTDKLLVAEFVTGIFLTDLIRAVDSKDEATIARMRAQLVDPEIVARRLVLAVHWELLEGLLFHADPHPANILVQPGNKIVFIDFGSCGRLSGKTRRIWRHFYYAFCDKDVQGMAERAVAILEPVPRADIDAFTKEIEGMFWDWVHAMKSDHAEWWEKAGGIMWMRFTGMARRYGVPITPDVLRIFRATFLYDTTIFRLWVSLDQVEEFREYHREAGKRARKRVHRAIAKRLHRGLTKNDYVRIENLNRMAGQILQRVQHYLDIFEPGFMRVIGKLAFVATLVLRLGTWALGIYVVGTGLVTGYKALHGEAATIHLNVGALTLGWRGMLLGALLTWFLIRRVLVRIREIEAG